MQYCLPLAGYPCGHMHATWLRHGQHNFAWRRTGLACKNAGAASVPPPQEPDLPGDNTSPSSQQEHSSAQDSGGGIGARVKRFFLGAVAGDCPSAFQQTISLNALLFLPHLPHNVTKWTMQVTRWTRTAWQSWVWGQWPAMVSCMPRCTYMALQQAGGFDSQICCCVSPQFTGQRLLPAGFVSNLTYGTGLSLSWIAFVHQLGEGSSALELRAASVLPVFVF